MRACVCARKQKRDNARLLLRGMYTYERVGRPRDVRARGMCKLEIITNVGAAARTHPLLGSTARAMARSGVK